MNLSTRRRLTNKRLSPFLFLTALTAVAAIEFVSQSSANASIIAIDFESITPGSQSAGFLSSQGISSVTILRGGSVSEPPFVLAEGTDTNSTNPGFGNFLTAGNSISAGFPESTDGHANLGNIPLAA